MKGIQKRIDFAKVVLTSQNLVRSEIMLRSNWANAPIRKERGLLKPRESNCILIMR